MARQILVLALVLIALVGMVSADTKAAAFAAAPGNNGAIGNLAKVAGAPSNGGGDCGIVEGPLGSTVNAIIGAATGQPPSSNGGTTVGLLAFAGALAVAGYFVF